MHTPQSHTYQPIHTNTQPQWKAARMCRHIPLCFSYLLKFHAETTMACWNGGWKAVENRGGKAGENQGKIMKERERGGGDCDKDTGLDKDMPRANEPN